jgi:predicted phage terminase large subunit-like protein
VTISRQDAARILLQRQDAADSFAGFVTYLRRLGVIDYEPAAHHLAIIERLQAVADGDIRRLMILMPPGSAKSTYGSVLFALWWLLRNPSHLIITASNSEGLAERFNRQRRALMQEPGLEALYGTQIAADGQAVGHWTLETGGSIRAAGVGSTLVGHRSHLNILDDPITGAEQAMSPTQLAKQAEWYFSDFRSRLRPDGCEVVIMQRWSTDDIAGHLLREERDKWTVLELPMEAAHDDPLGRKPGEMLWPEWYRPEQVEEWKREPARWAALFQQQPLDTHGAWVGMDDLIVADEAPENLRISIGIDIALGTSTGDYSVAAVTAIDAERNYWVLRVLRSRSDPTTFVEDIFALCDAYKPLDVLIDDDNASRVFFRLMRERGKIRGKTIPLREVPIRGRSKEVRNAPLRNLALNRRLHVLKGDWNHEFLAELTKFPRVTHDDQVDAVGLPAAILDTLNTPEAPKEPETIPEQVVLIGGRRYLNHGLNELFEQASNDRPKGAAAMS